jgi:GTPase Era involved in 16S rRNA processing
LGAKVYFTSWVKIRDGWRDNPNFIRGMGYRTDD